MARCESGAAGHVKTTGKAKRRFILQQNRRLTRMFDGFVHPSRFRPTFRQLISGSKWRLPPRTLSHRVFTCQSFESSEHVCNFVEARGPQFHTASFASIRAYILFGIGTYIHTVSPRFASFPQSRVILFPPKIINRQ